MEAQARVASDFPSSLTQPALSSYIDRILDAYKCSQLTFVKRFAADESLLAKLRAFSWDRLAWAVPLDPSMSDTVRASLFCLKARDVAVQRSLSLILDKENALAGMTQAGGGRPTRGVPLFLILS